MQTNQSIKKRLLPFPFLFGLFFILTTLSCNNQGIKLDDSDCIIITRSQISTNMLAGDWSAPGNKDYIPYIYFYPAVIKGEIDVSAYPADKDNNIYETRKVTITPARKNPPCSFPDSLVLVPNRYDFSSEGFADTNGSLKQFDYLKLEPRACTDPGYTDKLVFDVYMVTGDKVEAKGSTKPCPPYCPTDPDLNKE